MRWAICAVTLLALAFLLLRAGRAGLAGDYIDPVGRIGAQDESLYSNSAIHMAEEGNWLTPMFLGRYGLYKPPLEMCAAGLAVRILGISRLALRLPTALFAAFAVSLVFLWGAELRNPWIGACAAALVVSNHLWHVLCGMCITDGFLVAFTVAAMYCLYADPWLESKGWLWGFAGAVAGGILTKSVAGVLPLGMLGLYWLAAPRNHRPRFRRVVLAAALALALAAPWFLYQAAVHGRWFWAEHVQVEILAFGTGQPPQTSQENPALFYTMRLALLDPVLLSAAAIALPWFVKDVLRRSAPSVLLLCWMAPVAGSVLFWQYRNASYLLPLVPALAILGAAYGPLASARYARWTLVLLAVALAAKVSSPGAPWGLSFRGGSAFPSQRVLSDYCERGRGNELVLVDADEELYASVLPLPRVRYGFVGAAPPPGEYSLDFPYMGIMLNAEQFIHLSQWTPIFRRHLREWGLDSAAPIGSVVFAPTPKDLAEIVRAHPESDFSIPQRYRAAVAPAAQATHDVVTVAPDRFMLLSRQAVPRGDPARWSCRL